MKRNIVTASLAITWDERFLVYHVDARLKKAFVPGTIIPPEHTTPSVSQQLSLLCRKVYTITFSFPLTLILPDVSNVPLPGIRTNYSAVHNLLETQRRRKFNLRILLEKISVKRALWCSVCPNQVRSLDASTNWSEIPKWCQMTLFNSRILSFIGFFSWCVVASFMVLFTSLSNSRVTKIVTKACLFVNWFKESFRAPFGALWAVQSPTSRRQLTDVLPAKIPYVKFVLHYGSFSRIQPILMEKASWSVRVLESEVPQFSCQLFCRVARGKVLPWLLPLFPCPCLCS